MSDADTCRAHGWGVGTVLRGTEWGEGWSHTTTIRLTAIGERSILAVAVEEDGKTLSSPETIWTLSERDWQEVKAKGG